MDTNIHIMLDLECTSVTAPNPCIIEIGAVYFDLDTGHEYGHYRTAVNLQSCTMAGLVTDRDTMDWLERNIPQKLDASKIAPTTISQALQELTAFLNISQQATKRRLEELGRANSASEIRVWGNGATVDNSGSLRHTKNYGDFVGRNFPKEVFQGVKHDAIDDARHQSSAQSSVPPIQFVGGVLTPNQGEHETNALQPILRLEQSGTSPDLGHGMSHMLHTSSRDMGAPARMPAMSSNERGSTKLKPAGIGSWVMKAAPKPFSGGRLGVDKTPLSKSSSEAERMEARPFGRGQISLQDASRESGKLLSKGGKATGHEVERTARNEITSNPGSSLDTDRVIVGEDDSQLMLLGTYKYPPGIVPDHPCEYTRDQDFKVSKFGMSQTRTKIEITTSLKTSLDAIKALPLTPKEQEQIMRGSPNRNAWSLLRNIEFSRALTFSPNFQSMIKDHQVSLLNGWGLGIDHEATCLTLPGEWISSSPEALHQMWLKNTADVLTRFLPKDRNVSADSTKARIFATVANATTGKMMDTDKTKHASHTCGNPYCLIPRHINMEDPNLNYQRDGCRLRALELRRKGLPVSWKCGVHGPGEDDCLMQLMALTDVERMNLQLSLHLGHPLTNPIQDPKHGFVTEVRSFEDFDGGFNFGTKDPSLDRLMVYFHGEREKMADPKASCPLCGRTWLVASVVLLNHIVKDHASHKQLVSAVLQVAKELISDIEMRRKGSKAAKVSSVIGQISQSLLETEATLDRDQVIEIIRKGQKLPKKRYTTVEEEMDKEDEER
ncbi:hypothetical protein BKA64DRAFT_720121 [Cadophora sp. MPI-SDFR-AT-0126]|nr:hypothetical protein BKA64DRAFT_720121 [Leotiomycetes sp. MPI-SDFR-AT-0126]